MPTPMRHWIVQLGTAGANGTFTLDWPEPDGLPQTISTDTADPDEIAATLLAGYVAEHAGRLMGLDRLMARVWVPADHEHGRPHTGEAGPVPTTYAWGWIADQLKLDSDELRDIAAALPSPSEDDVVLPDGSGVTADGYAILAVAARS